MPILTLPTQMKSMVIKLHLAAVKPIMPMACPVQGRDRKVSEGLSSKARFRVDWFLGLAVDQILLVEGSKQSTARSLRGDKQKSTQRSLPTTILLEANFQKLIWTTCSHENTANDKQRNKANVSHQCQELFLLQSCYSSQGRHRVRRWSGSILIQSSPGCVGEHSLELCNHSNINFQKQPSVSPGDTAACPAPQSVWFSLPSLVISGLLAN